MYRGIKMAVIGKVEYVAKVISEICGEHGVSMDDVKNPRRRWWGLVDARRAICKYLLDNTTMPIGEIAEFLGHSRSQARMGEGMFKFDKRLGWLKEEKPMRTQEAL
jgi:hypothetical protein